MLSDKEFKVEFKKKTSKEPERYYPVETLRSLGFIRKQCVKCKRFFWNLEGDLCGDPMCSGGFRFIGKSPAKNQLTYIEVWKQFSKIFKNFDYTPVKRYPVVSRWNPTTDFTIASIAAFQPFVVTGEVKPPAKQLVIPQFCLRFGDVDNVGITGHNTGFVMMGQHAFVEPEEYDPNAYLMQIYTWLEKGLGLPKKEITFHEDAWAGGGNFGACVEFFSRGLEIGNQVYMEFEQTSSGYRELNIKVLDMGEGQERAAWFTQGTSTNYDATFPTVMKSLYKATGIKIDADFMKKFLPYSSYLNVDEVEDMEKQWKEVAHRLDMDAEELKKKVTVTSALYSIAEHSRSLLFALNDGGLPSNVGGGYNLRMIYRRALGFIDKFGWNLSMNDLAEEHAKYLKPLYPELRENLEDVKKILDVEKSKYYATKQKSSQLVAALLKKGKITEETLLEQYDSNGIPPGLIQEEAEKLNVPVKIPDDFYLKIAERHEKVKQVHETGKDAGLPLNDLKETEALYFADYTITRCKATVLRVIDSHVILDKTVFYPTSGGQMHDVGTIGGNKVMEVFKQGPYVVHKLEKKPEQELEGLEVECEIDWKRRRQLAQHHTSTHILNAAARRVLGNHINQAGARKDVDKAHIDITHYQSLSQEEMEAIEKEANKIIQEKIQMQLGFMPRDEAESRFGTGIYQGGVAPGKSLRIVNIPEVDVEACGGTHLKNTFEAEKIKILKSTKVQDGIVRIVFAAGAAANTEVNRELTLLKQTAEILGVDVEQVPSRAQELFDKWKIAKKVKSKGQPVAKEIKKLNILDKEKLSHQELLEKTAGIFKTQAEHVPKTAMRFLKELEEA
ncbi:alanine--tRNA ligase [Candidatus Woesearchaeota archaeon]|nr:alanine--tRNA ligase [Candidatus Woesearchaeota archaeon]